MIFIQRLQKDPWLLAAIATFLLRLVSGLLPTWTEQIYSRGIFRVIRWLFDNLVSWFPIPLFYIFWALVALLAYQWIKRLIGWQKPLPERLSSSAISLLHFVSVLYVMFGWFWGFNYDRISFEKQAGFELVEPDSTTLRAEMEWAAQDASSERGHLNETDVIGYQQNDNLANLIQPAIVNVVRKWGYPADSKVRIVQLFPKGILMRFSTSGVYMPFFGQSNMDSGLHPLEKPFVMAHELAHGYGFTDEGVCNFLAYLACIGSEDAFIRYSGKLNYFRSVAASYKSFAPEPYQQFRSTLPKSMIADLDAINRNLQAYPDLIPLDALYNQFLKWQGIEEGAQNYSKVILFVRSWRGKLKPI